MQKLFIIYQLFFKKTVILFYKDDFSVYWVILIGFDNLKQGKILGFLLITIDVL